MVFCVALRVKCGPCSLRGPPAASTEAHVGNSMIPFASQRIPSGLLKRYGGFLQNPRKKDKEGPDEQLEIGRGVPEGTVEILLLALIFIDLPPLLAIQWSLLILPWHLFKWQKKKKNPSFRFQCSMTMVNHQDHQLWDPPDLDFVFQVCPLMALAIWGSYLISVSSCVKVICKLLGGNDNQIDVIWRASVLFEQVLFSTLWITWPLDQ